MRIVSGAFGGRKIVAPKGDKTRPTTDRARETLFNMLGHKISFDGARVLDLFAGSGALGLEALSRGASTALFIEMDSAARGAIRQNMHALGVHGRSKIFRRDATKLGDIGTISPFDLIFADPPYAKGLGEAAMISASQGGWLKSGAMFVLEEAKAAQFQLPSGFELSDERVMGDTLLRFIIAA